MLGYLKAYEVENTVASMPAATGATAARWNSVKTIRICVLVRSENPVADSIASARYLDCNGTLITAPPDTRLRRAFTTTVVLRNQ